MRAKLSLAGDMCMPHPFLLSLHDALCIEAPTPIMWPPGFALQQNKLTRTVFHKGQFMALAGHDCGHWIPHVWAPPFPPLPLVCKLPLIIARSRRKMLFSSSTVKADGSQIGCSQLLGDMFLPMQTCGSPLAAPTSSPLLNFLHSVSVNMTMGDLVAGLLEIALSMAGAALAKMIPPGLRLKGVARELLGAGSLQEFGLKTAMGVLVSGARIAATQEGELGMSAGSTYLKAGASLGIKREGRMGFSAGSQVFTGSGIRQDRVSHTYAGGGKVIRSVSTRISFPQHAWGISTNETFMGRERIESKTATWGQSL